jgi:uncharacterized protein
MGGPVLDEDTFVDFRVQPPFGGFLGTHFHRDRDAVAQPLLDDPLGLDREPTASFRDRSMATFIAEMDEAGVDVAVVMGHQTDPRWGFVDNADVARLAADHPTRLIPFAGVDPGHPDAMQEVERALGELECRGLSLTPGWSDPPIDVDDRRLDPIYAACHDAGVPVVLTMSHYLGADLHASDPVRVQRLAERWDDLTIIVGHGAYPWVVQACAIAMRYPNVYLLPDTYLHGPGVPGASAYRDAVVGAVRGKFLYSSCYPARSFAQSRRNLASLSLPEEAERLLTNVNPRRVLEAAGTAAPGTRSG